MARLPWLRARPEAALRRMDPLLRWLALDGYGFHEGYFDWPNSVVQARTPGSLQGYQLRAFDQGLGRSLWFVNGADADRIPRTIATIPAARHSDLWSGVGLACAYAGGADEHAVQYLMASAGPHAAAFSQGVAFAAKARQKAGNPTGHTEEACRIACGLTADEAAALADETRKDLAPSGAEPAYEIWRQRLQRKFTNAHVSSDGKRGK